MADKSLHIKKQLIESLEKSLGVVTTACKSVGISRQTYYDYYNSDPEFKKKCDELENLALDFAESQLHKRIKDGSDAATIFFLKCKGKKRGYVERSEIEANVNMLGAVVDWTKPSEGNEKSNKTH
jgi:hypothetical protein